MALMWVVRWEHRSAECLARRWAAAKAGHWVAQLESVLADRSAKTSVVQMDAQWAAQRDDGSVESRDCPWVGHLDEKKAVPMGILWAARWDCSSVVPKADCLAATRVGATAAY